MFSRSADILVADLSAVVIDEDILSVAELGRALGFSSPASLTEYLAARTWLRHRLGEYLDADPASICFEVGEHGRPGIVAPATDLSFSLSYSGWTAALVAGFRLDVGVDIENVDEATVNLSMMDSVLSNAEQRVCNGSANPMQSFLRLWVRKEALAKANGVGVELNTEETTMSGVSPVTAGGFEITDINLGGRLVAAVAAPEGTRLDLAIVDVDRDSSPAVTSAVAS